MVGSRTFAADVDDAKPTGTTAAGGSAYPTLLIHPVQSPRRSPLLLRTAFRPSRRVENVLDESNVAFVVVGRARVQVRREDLLDRERHLTRRGHRGIRRVDGVGQTQTKLLPDDLSGRGTTRRAADDEDGFLSERRSEVVERVIGDEAERVYCQILSRSLRQDGSVTKSDGR